MTTRKKWLVLGLALFLAPHSAHAYIGPGAGFAFLGSTLVFVVTFLLALATLLFWPLQWVWRKARGFGISKQARVRRAVIVGLDGLEPKLVDQFMQAGLLTNMAALKGEGCYARLGTTLPALSPVAWSTFQTGVNPGAHNIFDFLTRDKRTCLPELASTETRLLDKVIGLFGIGLKVKRPEIRITRKSQPFWKVLGKHGVFSNVIRVPISYPPEPFYGNALSAMCTPDLRGTQGTFSFYTTNSEALGAATGGERQLFKREGEFFAAELVGPPSPKDGAPLKLAFALRPIDQSSAELRVADRKIKLELDKFSDWIVLEFKFGWRKKISGIARFCLRQAGAHLSLYVSPINVNPEDPSIPIAHPIYFSTWLAKKHGLYGTLGLMEDTWGRNEFALDDQRFLEQSYLTHAEREKMFFEALEKTPEGVCVCVFDASDRIQHMFWRYLDDQHPSPRESDQFKHTIRDMYVKMDELVGRVRAKLGKDDLLCVISDHGFASFRRCVNLNTWLMEQGYLALKDVRSGRDYFQDVDWSKTKAFAVGLSGLYINKQGRERNGTVAAAEFTALKQEIAAKLEQLRDPQGGAAAIAKVYDTAKHYKGMYTEEAPDLIVGYNPGFRISWDSITGAIEPHVFSDNLKAWSGDHHVDPKAIPGVFFSNRNLKVSDPHIMDIAPTMLDLFAVKVPPYMEGRVLM